MSTYKHVKRIVHISPLKKLTKIIFLTLDVDECIARPCLNGGTCQNQYGNYSCVCRQGYGGRHCETSRLNLDNFKLKKKA